MSRAGTIGVLPPRYGPEVVGGAEAVLSELAHGLAAVGWDIEILTTCAVDHYTWANHYPPGVSTDGSLTVRRFPTVMDTPGTDRDRIGHRILMGEEISIVEQQRWLNDSLRVPEMWHHVSDHLADYRAILAGPYMFWTTAAVGALAADRLILMPCFHDEPPGKLSVFNPLFAGARGVLFLSEPEAEQAARDQPLPRRREVVGAGVAVPKNHAPDRFREQFGIDGPFIYYAGRREYGKGWEELLEVYQRLDPSSLALVTSGVGAVPDIPGVIDVGFIDDAQRTNAMAAATAYVQPSAMESFSRTVLEAMLAGTPVIANGKSDVVTWHLDRSGTGLRYNGLEELERALRLVVRYPDDIARLADGGRDYVIDNYASADVVARVDELLQEWLPEPA